MTPRFRGLAIGMLVAQVAFALSAELALAAQTTNAQLRGTTVDPALLPPPKPKPAEPHKKSATDAASKAAPKRPSSVGVQPGNFAAAPLPGGAKAALNPQPQPPKQGVAADQLKSGSPSSGANTGFAAGKSSLPAVQKRGGASSLPAVQKGGALSLPAVQRGGPSAGNVVGKETQGVLMNDPKQSAGKPMNGPGQMSGTKHSDRSQDMGQPRH